MTATPSADGLGELERTARARFVRWDAGLWRTVIDGPARRLDAGLAGSEPDEALAVMTAYLELAAEGIGLGLLVPSHGSGVSNFFTLAWTRLLPELLPGLPPRRRAESLAACWNLGENLESAEPWLDRLFVRASGDLASLDDLDALVERVSSRVLEPPPDALGSDWTARWIALTDHDPRFLPGRLHFVAPTVVCVHDRHEGPGSGVADTCGAWLDDPPVVLGPMGCREEPPPPGRRPGFVSRLAREEPRFTRPHAWTRNEWRGAVTLTTSQHVVAVSPA